MNEWMVILAVYISQGLIVFGETISTTGDAVAGRPFALECRINRLSPDCNPLCSSVYWILTDGFAALYASLTCRSSIPVLQPGYSGGCYNHTSGEEVYTLRIDNVTEDMDRVTLVCEYFGTVRKITLDVNVMVAQVRVQNSPSTVLAGNSTTFTCVTSRSKPRACIRGYIRSSGNVRQLGPTDCNQDSSTTRITTRTLRFTATAEDNGAVLYCTADNSVTDPPVRSQNHTLDVQYSPVNGVILISSYVNNTPIESGATVTLTCQVGKGNPRPVLTWTPECGQTSTDSGNDGSQQISIRITVSPSLNRKSCVFIPDRVQLISDSGQSRNTVRVTNNSTVTFTCNSSESNPAVVLTWYNNSSPIPAAELSEVRSERGPNLGYLITQRYTVRVDRYQDGNVIRCAARRSDQTTPVYPSTLILDVRYSPMITCNHSQVTVFEGQRLTISCDVVSKPEATLVWVKDNTEVDREYISNSPNQDGRNIQTSSLVMTSARSSLSGLYHFKATNEIGSSRADVSINVIDGQYIPKELLATSCAKTKAVLVWASVIDNSLVEYYKLEFKASRDVWSGRLVRNPGRVKLVQTTLSDLQPGVLYQFRLQPNTDIVLSEYATANCTVEEAGTDNEGLSKGGMFGVGLTVGIISVIVVIICVTFWRRGYLKFYKGRNSPQKDAREANDGNSRGPPPMVEYDDVDTGGNSGPQYEELSGMVSSPRSSAVYANTTPI